MSRRWQLRDAAVGYAARGIPVLPLYYPLPDRGGLQPVGGTHPPTPGAGCSCRDPGCGQPGKHPQGSLVPHGVKDATTNRARILAWWTRHPQANIGLATGHRFDVLDVDGPRGAQAIRALAATHGLESSGPWSAPAAGGISTWPPRASATPGLTAWRMWIGGVGVAMWSPHPAATPPATPPGPVPVMLLDRLRPRQVQRPTSPVQLPAAADGPVDRYVRAALAEELARVATAPKGQRNRQLWESTRNLYNLVATGALDPREVDHGLLDAAERCGLLAEEPRQTRRTLASGRQVGLAHPGRPRQPSSPERTQASPPLRAVGDPAKERG